MSRRLILAPLLFLSLAAGCDGGSSAAAEANQIAAKAHSAIGVRPLTARVMDDADLLPPAAQIELERRLAALEKRTTDQLVVVTLPDLGGQPIEEVSLGLANGWGVGRADVHNGVLLVVAPNERKVRIEVGRGLEGLLTDSRAQAIIDTALLPRLRRSAWEEALREGVGQIEEALDSDLRRPLPGRSEQAA